MFRATTFADNNWRGCNGERLSRDIVVGEETQPDLSWVRREVTVTTDCSSRQLRGRLICSVPTLAKNARWGSLRGEEFLERRVGQPPYLNGDVLHLGRLCLYTAFRTALRGGYFRRTPVRKAWESPVLVSM